MYAPYSDLSGIKNTLNGCKQDLSRMEKWNLLAVYNANG
jgi:hypothetical protein